MREVIYYKNQWIKESNRHEKVEVGKAKFHQFGVGFEESENGPGNYSTAIIETEEGSVLNIPVEMIRFVS